MKYFGLLFFLLMAMFCIVFGFQFNRGKWLRALSGNTFKDNQFNHEKAVIIGKKTSKVLYVAAFISICLGLYAFFVVG